MPVEAVFFDLYGTLVVDSDIAEANRAWSARLREFAGSRGVVFAGEHETFKAFWSKPMPPKEGASTPFMRRLREFTAAAKPVESVGGADDDEATFSALADELCSLWQEKLPLADDAIEVIGTLAARYRVAVVSNYGHPPHVRAFLETTGVAPLLDAIVVSGDHPFEKPDPRLLLEAAAATGSSATGTVYVGDSIVDYEAATSAGMMPVLIRRRREETGVTVTGGRFSESDRRLDTLVDRGELIRIRSLSELLPLLEELDTDEDGGDHR